MCPGRFFVILDGRRASAARSSAASVRAADRLPDVNLPDLRLEVRYRTPPLIDVGKSI
jgi:hypothetical protein